MFFPSLGNSNRHFVHPMARNIKVVEKEYNVNEMINGFESLISKLIVKQTKPDLGSSEMSIAA